MSRFAVVGASGRTGSHVVQALAESKDSSLGVALVSATSASLGVSVPRSDVSYSSDLSALQRCDGVIDFSTPVSTLEIARRCAEYRKPLLVGTTGLGAAELSALDECARVVPVCLSTNTSVGATVLAMAATYMQRLLGPSFDVEVMEIHHRMKRDAPSGTAKTVVAGLAADNKVVFGREGERRAGEIGVVSLRGGDVPGDHTVFFFGEGERLEVSHRAQNRGIFGRGAVVLAERLIGRQPGFYTVQELLLGGQS